MSEEERQCRENILYTIQFRSDANNGRKSNVEWNVDTTTSSFNFSAAYHKTCNNALAIVDAIAASRAGKFVNIIKCNQIAYEKWIYSNWAHTRRYPILFLHKFSGRMDSNYALFIFCIKLPNSVIPAISRCIHITHTDNESRSFRLSDNEEKNRASKLNLTIRFPWKNGIQENKIESVECSRRHLQLSDR